MTYCDHTFLTNMFRLLLLPSSGWNYYKNTRYNVVSRVVQPAYHSVYKSPTR